MKPRPGGFSAEVNAAIHESRSRELWASYPAEGWYAVEVFPSLYSRLMALLIRKPELGQAGPAGAVNQAIGEWLERNE